MLLIFTANCMVY